VKNRSVPFAGWKRRIAKREQNQDEQEMMKGWALDKSDKRPRCHYRKMPSMTGFSLKKEEEE